MHTFGRSKKNCLDARIIGAVLHILQRGRMSSTAFISFPQPSH